MEGDSLVFGDSPAAATTTDQPAPLPQGDNSSSAMQGNDENTAPMEEGEYSYRLNVKLQTLIVSCISRPVKGNELRQPRIKYIRHESTSQP